MREIATCCAAFVLTVGALDAEAAARAGAAPENAKATPRPGVLVAGPVRTDEEILLCRKEEGARARREVGPEIQAPAEPVKLRSTSRKLSQKECDAQARKWNFWSEENEAKGCFVNMFVRYPGMITGDVATGLQWAWGTTDELGHSEALALVQQLNAKGWQGHRDWRLPTSEEVFSILESVESPQWMNHLWDGIAIQGRGCWTADAASSGGKLLGVDFDGVCSERAPNEQSTVVIVRTMAGEEWAQARQKYKPLTQLP